MKRTVICSFWMDLWEKSGTGHEDVKWLRPIKEVIAKKVPPPSDESWAPHTTQAVKILSKKWYWSAPGPNKLINYWLCKVIRQLLKNWNTQNIVRTKCGPETSRTIPFMRGSTSAAMNNIGLHWDSKRCNTIHVKRGSLGNDAATSFTIRYRWFKVLKKVQGTSSSEYAKQWNRTRTLLLWVQQRFTFSVSLQSGLALFLISIE